MRRAFRVIHDGEVTNEDLDSFYVPSVREFHRSRTVPSFFTTHMFSASRDNLNKSAIHKVLKCDITNI